jgi:hypothetical protein
MAGPLYHHSTTSDHEPLLRDFQGQGNDPERQDRKLSSPENDSESEDGRKKEDMHIYPKWLAGLNGEANLEDIKFKHQDHHSTWGFGESKIVSPYQHYYSAPLLPLEVRCLCLY